MSCETQTLPSSAVADLQEFLIGRWARVGGTGGIRGIATTTGLSPGVFYRLTPSVGSALRADQIETREQIAMALRFRSWRELIEAFESDDVLHGLPVVRLSAVAMELARRGSKADGLGLDEWVSAKIEQLASAPARAK